MHLIHYGTHGSSLELKDPAGPARWKEKSTGSWIFLPPLHSTISKSHKFWLKIKQIFDVDLKNRHVETHNLSLWISCFQWLMIANWPHCALHTYLKIRKAKAIRIQILLVSLAIKSLYHSFFHSRFHSHVHSFFLSHYLHLFVLGY